MPEWKLSHPGAEKPHPRGDGLLWSTVRANRAMPISEYPCRHRRSTGRSGVYRRREIRDSARRAYRPEFVALIDAYVERRYGRAAEAADACRDRQAETRVGASILRRHGWRLALVRWRAVADVGFMALVDEMREAEAFPFDEPILLFAHQLARDGLTESSCFFRAGLRIRRGAVRHCPGDRTGLARHFRESIFTAIALGGSALLNVAAKQAFSRARPSLWESISPETT